MAIVVVVVAAVDFVHSNQRRDEISREKIQDKFVSYMWKIKIHGHTQLKLLIELC